MRGTQRFPFDLTEPTASILFGSTVRKITTCQQMVRRRTRSANVRRSPRCLIGHATSSDRARRISRLDCLSAHGRDLTTPRAERAPLEREASAERRLLRERAPSQCARFSRRFAYSCRRLAPPLFEQLSLQAEQRFGCRLVRPRMRDEHVPRKRRRHRQSPVRHRCRGAATATGALSTPSSRTA